MIQINLLRISPDSQYLEFSVECPTGYVFNQLYITRYLGDHVWDTEILDGSAIYTQTSTKEVIRVATASLGDNITMYKVEFGVTSINGGEAIDNSLAYCSNINNVYANLLDIILKLNTGCILPSEYENMVRNYMFFYAHIEAMRLNRIYDAETFYDLVMNLFTNCGSTTRTYRTLNKQCNCA